MSDIIEKPLVSLTRNPATGETLAEHPLLADSAVEGVLEAAAQGYRAWKALSVAERVDIFRRLAGVLRERKQALAEQATLEMGKPITQARAEVEKCAVLCEWYAEHGPAMLADEPVNVDAGRAYVSYHPIGTVLAVMPWNFPYWQAMRAAIPVMLGGNGFLLKPSADVIGSGKLLHDAWEAAGVPAGAFLTAHISREQTPRIIADDRIAGVTLTGGTTAGAIVAGQAAKALKKSLLELGGSDPLIVLADADLDAAVKAAVTARFQNCGQVCIAAKRLIVEAPIAEAFTERFLAAVAALKIGDPREDDTFVGPMSRADLRDELHAQVEAAVAGGAELLAGGHKLPGTGNFYAPTVLGNVTPGNVAFDSETFGPVAAIIVARDADHAVALANDSAFGLSSSLWTAEPARAADLAARLETGGVFVNGISVSDPRIPIGGIKQSGYGRELSYFGVREFLNAKTVWLR